MRSNWADAGSCFASWATMLDPQVSLALAEQVAEAAKRLGLDTALIGAGALAVHRYTRGTEDLDLAVNVDPYTRLPALQQSLAADGLQTEMRLPDNDDPLGGVLVVWLTTADDGAPADVVEVVNFNNPGRMGPTPAPMAIARAQPLPGSPLRCVTIEDLVALKLYAGGLSDHADVVELLARNPDVDLDAVRSAAAPFDRDARLEVLMEQAKARRRSLR